MTRHISRRDFLRYAGLTAAGVAACGQTTFGTAHAAGPDYGPSPDAPNQEPNPPEHAARAADFLSSLGVCTHIGQGVDSASPAAAALSYLGVYNIRDDASAAHVQDWITVHKQSGAHIDLLTNHDLTGTIDMANQLMKAGALMAVEGPNEPNNWPVTYEGQTSGYTTTFLPVAHFQRDFYSATKADPALKGIPVFASSEAGGSEPDNVGLQFLTIPNGAGTLMPDGTRYADYANTHTYVMGHVGKWLDNLAWNSADPTLNGDPDGLYVEFGHTWHGHFDGYSTEELRSLPRVMTETGWPTRGDGSITEEQQGRIIMSIYLSNFTRRWTNTFIYMLRDDPVQGYWGLIDQDYKPKLSGQYMHNLTTILADSGSDGTTRAPGTLHYSIPSKTSTVHDLLLQKSNGEFYLVVWNELSIGSANSTVDLGRTFKNVEIYDPTAGTSAIRTLHNVSSIDLMLEGYGVLILKL